MIQKRAAISQPLTEILIVVTLFVAALTLRIYRLQTFPPGLYTDEAAYGLDALEVLDGNLQVFFPRNNGREPLFIYLLASVFSILGATPYTLRLTAAVCGAATVVTTYWMVWQQYSFQPLVHARSARWYALWSALFLAFSYWHISFSRLGFRAITLPLMTTLAFGFMWFTWRHVREQQSVSWAASLGTGFAVGLCIYTYTAGRMAFPLFLVIAAAALAFGPRVGLNRRQLSQSIAISVAGAVLTMLPLIIYFLRQPAAFGEHATFVSVFNPQITGERGPALATLDSTRKMLLMFIKLPDPNLRHNPGRIPVFDPLLAVWLVLALGVTVARWRHLPSLFALLWFGIFLLPAALTAEGVPHSLRAIGMLPMVYVLPVAAMDWVSTRVLRQGYWWCWLPLPFLIVAAITGINAYRSAMSQPERFAASFFVSFWDLAQSLRDDPDDTVAWILPLPPGEDLTDDRLYTAEFALRDPDALSVVRLNEATLPEELTRITANKQVVNVLDTYAVPELRKYDTRFMDPKKLLALLLRRNVAGEITEGTRAGLPYTSYPLVEVPDFALPRSRTVDNDFGDIVRLHAANVGTLFDSTSQSQQCSTPEVSDLRTVCSPNDQYLWVALKWQALDGIHDDVKISIRLRTPGGELGGQIDDFLVSNRAPRHPTWLPGQEADSYLTFKPWAALPPGRYSLEVKVYDGSTGAAYGVLPADGSANNWLPLAVVDIVPPVRPGGKVTPSTILTDTLLSPELRLFGADLGASQVQPGDTVGFTLFFQALSQPQTKSVVVAELRDSDGQIILEQAQAPGGVNFPTSEWRAGEVVRNWYNLSTEVTTPPGRYDLFVREAGHAAATLPIHVHTIDIAYRPRVLTPPAMTAVPPVTFGETVQLRGYVADSTLMPAPGVTMTMTLVWQPLATPASSFVRFVQVLDASGALVAQQDTRPCEGQCPSTSWLPGEYLLDVVAVTLPSDLETGAFHIITGWYEPTTQRRLPATDDSGNPLPDDVATLPATFIP